MRRSRKIEEEATHKIEMCMSINGSTYVQIIIEINWREMIVGYTSAAQRTDIKAFRVIQLKEQNHKQPKYEQTMTCNSTVNVTKHRSDITISRDGWGEIQQRNKGKREIVKLRRVI